MTLKDTWINVINELGGSLDRSKLITWFKNTAILRVENGTAVVGLPLPFFLNWHESHFSKATLAALKKQDESIKQVAYEVDLALGENDPRAIDVLAHFPEKKTRKLPQQNRVKMPSGLVSQMFNPKYTLENFITAPENRLAHAACQTIARTPGMNYNPLVIYGNVGLGKTHLLQATGAEMLKNDPNRVVQYMTTEMFVNNVVKAIKNGEMEKIRSKYRKVDAFLIDDIQFLANKDRCEEEFFHTFNALYECGKQIIISSDRAPHELTLLSDRLKSRLQSGMVVELQMPSMETRLSILLNKMEGSEMMIKPEVLEHMATKIDSSVRALEGALTRTIAAFELEQAAPTIQSVNTLLKDLMPKAQVQVGIIDAAAPNQAVTLESLIDGVCQYFGLERADVLGSSRAREFVTPRQIIMWIAKSKLRLSLSHIGKTLGGRNHTTVMSAVARISEQIKSDAHLMGDINGIAREIGLKG